MSSFILKKCKFFCLLMYSDQTSDLILCLYFTGTCSSLVLSMSLYMYKVYRLHFLGLTNVRVSSSSRLLYVICLLVKRYICKDIWDRTCVDVPCEDLVWKIKTFSVWSLENGSSWWSSIWSSNGGQDRSTITTRLNFLSHEFHSP